MVKKGKPSSAAEEGLIVTAQQSRFHTDAENTPATGKEIVVKDLSITVSNRELLSHAELNLQSGRHYVLVGRNGTGKSTLLKALGQGIVPGIPSSVRILLLGQIQEHAGASGQAPALGRETVLEHVLRSDQHRQRLQTECEKLLEAFEDSGDPLAVVRTYRELSKEHTQMRLAEAKLVAERRSGARGLKARKALTQVEDELSEATAHLESLGISQQEDATVIASETQKAQEQLTNAQAALEDMNAAKAEAHARAVLLGLGFSTDRIEKPVAELSGGWQTRCSLACALCQSSDLLLLDEPTNFLDLPSIVWLQTYVQNMDPKTTVIVVTHDRAFADGVGEELIVLRNQTLERFKGTISEFEVERLRKYKYLSRMADAQEKQKKHMQSSIENNVKAAKRAGDDKKLKQATSRKKKLDDRMGMEVSAKGTRFKLNRDLVGWHESRRDAIEVPTFDPPPRMDIPASPPELRFPGALVSLDSVSFRYRKTDRQILSDISLTIHMGDRVGLVGLNGSGKSTLVSLMMSGVDGESSNGSNAPTAGTVTRHTRARFGRFSQQAVEELDAIASDQPTLTALTHLIAYAGSEMPEKDARGTLSGLGLPGRIASDVPISLFSGGQKVRLALAKLLCAPPHLLVLDEVTTHLDSDSIQALALALRRYEGAVVVVTHDRFFMRCVVEGEHPRNLSARSVPDAEEDASDESGDDEEDARPGVVYRLSKSKLSKLERGMEAYEEIAARSASKLGKA